MKLSLSPSIGKAIPFVAVGGAGLAALYLVLTHPAAPPPDPVYAEIGSGGATLPDSFFSGLPGLPPLPGPLPHPGPVPPLPGGEHTPAPVPPGGGDRPQARILPGPPIPLTPAFVVPTFLAQREWALRTTRHLGGL